MKNKQMEVLLKNNEEFQDLLFKRGYLLTTKKYKLNEYPFYNNWQEKEFGRYNLYINNHQNVYSQVFGESNFMLMVGHAYNPWELESKETNILNSLLENYLKKDEHTFHKKLSEVTGVFALIIIEEEGLKIYQDSVGIMPVAYLNEYSNNQEFYSSHPQLIADLIGLEMDPAINKMIESKFYLIGIRHLPGIKTAYKELSALTANTYYSSKEKVKRFYPFNIADKKTEEESYNQIALILENSMKLISEKYNAAISLTGGVDSKMTLAASSNHFNKFTYFSFFSSDAEKKDAEAARNICNNLKLKHDIYEIPNINDNITDFNTLKKIIEHNTSYIKKYKDSELRKIMYLATHSKFDVEVKSHVSEIGRGFYYKKHGLKKMPKPLKNRHMSNLYKRNMFDRKALKFMDESFSEFIKITSFGDGFRTRYDESDMFYWEHRMSQWAALVKQDFDMSHETTIIYNNRCLLDLFMNFNLPDRIKDTPQNELIRKMNEEIVNLGISNNNAMKNKRRIMIERIFFKLNSIY